jgi:hypothetical protein
LLTLRVPFLASLLVPMLRKSRSRTNSISDVRPPSSLSSLPPLRTRLRGDSILDSCPPSSYSPVVSIAQPARRPQHPNRTAYRALPLEIHLYSPSVKSMTYDNRQLSRLLSVYGEHDQIQGKIILDPSCSFTGRLIVSIEGSFCYSGQNGQGFTGPRKHIFYSAQSTLSTCGGSDMPRSAFREAFSAMSLRRRTSASQLEESQSERVYPFAFDLPSGLRPGEELPPSFSTRQDQSSAFKDNTFEVTYRVMATWDPSDKKEGQSRLEAPFVYQPDTDFLSYDGLDKESTSWLEMPLKSDRKTSFKCAVTLPNPATFGRASPIPYFVVFSTTPRGSPLAKEIAADASISISLVRQIVVNESQPSTMLPTPPDTPSSSEEHSPTLPAGPMRRLRRMASNNSINRSSKAFDDCLREKQLPRLPTQVAFNESRILKSSVCLGFPKRPRHRCEPHGHPPLEVQSALPDGLHKSKIIPDKGMLPCIDWGGISVKYYLDVSVLFGQDDARARIPLRIC